MAVAGVRDAIHCNRFRPSSGHIGPDRDSTEDSGQRNPRRNSIVSATNDSVNATL
jgi:hypothetical protein